MARNIEHKNSGSVYFVLNDDGERIMGPYKTRGGATQGIRNRFRKGLRRNNSLPLIERFKQKRIAKYDLKHVETTVWPEG